MTLKLGSIIGARHRIVQAYPLTNCVYYDAAGLEDDAIIYLVRETTNPTRLPEQAVEQMKSLSQQMAPHLLPLLEIVHSSSHRYVINRHPGLGWRNLAKVPAPVRPLQQALDWTLQIGTALNYLHGAGIGGWPGGETGREAIVVLPDSTAGLADLTLCRPLDNETISADIRFLAALLTYLTTGRDQTTDDRLAGAPGMLRPIIRRAFNGAYADLESMLNDLKRSAEIPPLERLLRQCAGNATHRGRVRDLNQDFVAALTYSLDQSGQTAPVGLYIVADGMGGHMAGELASKGSARQAFMQFIEQRLLPELKGRTQRLNGEGEPGNILRTLIQQANQLVYQSRQASGSDRGTTITAAMIIGDKAVIANVGDSRTYLLRGDALNQITQDHSLVASLALAGQITPEEIYSHPDRHQIYRSLGERAEVEVDVYQQTLAKGDRLLLCSDGLWEMVRDPAIGDILKQAISAQAVCDRLLDKANAAGGEDNISAIVVDME